MFDLTGDDIAQLNDADLRTLAIRLALAELRAGGAPLASVTAGGSQDAADGGIDVRVTQAEIHAGADFVPRAETGFQVKKPDLAAKGIQTEMRPGGVLRPSIAALAEAGGAYVIASSGASLADPVLARRRAAMRAAIADHPSGHRLYVDYYDRDRLATWANQYPGVGAWVRRRGGRPIAGWRAVGQWRDLAVAEDAGYLADDGLSLIDEREGARTLPVLEGLDLLREILRHPRECVRLIGLSGVGKTRFVEALFEPGVGAGDPLDSGLALYADYADDTTPSAREMASRLVEEGHRAILIVDNCNPATHGQLAEICGRPSSPVSLLTVEYDIRDDEPERTQVFRLAAASEDLIVAWLERDFPNVSQTDRSRIAAFSGGNFRVARALADTVRNGESLGRLKDQDLFERIFRQRNADDQTLLRDAQMASLFYSFDISEDPEGELARIAAFAGREVSALFESLTHMQARGILQARGRWRAVLPHAIANPLAAGALKRLSPQAFDRFCASLPDRMKLSLSRRLGYLHDSPETRAATTRWLEPQGPLGDLLSHANLPILVNLAPVDPAAVLARLKAASDADEAQPMAATPSTERGSWLSLLKALAYDASLFPQAAWILATFVAAEAPDENYNSARGPFEELFQLYLSGTQATPEMRRALVRRLLESEDDGLRRAGRLALDSLLKGSHFSATSLFDFGARPRDHGWEPTTWAEIETGYVEALSLARQTLEPADQRRILAAAIRDLWRFEACRVQFEAAAAAFLTDGGWIEGWTALRVTLHYADEAMPEEIKARTRALIARLAPVDVVPLARAYVLGTRTGAWDVEDSDEDQDTDPMAGWRRAVDKAQDAGRQMADAPEALAVFLPEVFAANTGGERTPPFGLGLAEGAKDLRVLWARMLSLFATVDPAARNPTVLGNVLRGALARDPDFVSRVLDGAVDDPLLKNHIAFLQVVVGLDATGVDRLVRALAAAEDTRRFWHLSNTDAASLEPATFARLLDALAAKPGGVGVALDLLWRLFYDRDGEKPAVDALLIERGRSLLQQLKPDEIGNLRDYSLGYVVKGVLSGEAGRAAARTMSETFYAAYTAEGGWRLDGYGLVDTLFEVQPEIALDVFVGGPEGPVRRLFRQRTGRPSPLAKIDPALIKAWADADPERRYDRLGDATSLFEKDRSDNATALNPLFVALLERAPDKAAFLGEAYIRVHPSGWSGSLADILESRKRLLDGLPDHPDVAAWLARERPRVETWIARERQNEAEREERFE